MGILSQYPHWAAPTSRVVEPPSAKKAAGWLPDEKPPAGYFNWFWNSVSKALAELDVHLHDDRCYTESEVDAKLNTKSDKSHLHDDRYYTESEVDSKLSTKSDTSHNHDSRYVNVTGDTMTGTLTLAQGALLRKTTSSGSTQTVIDDAGKVWSAVYNDLAEMYPAALGEDIGPGDVVIWDGEALRKTDQYADPRVLGVYSDTYGWCLGGQPDREDGMIPIGIAGKVRVKAIGPVKPGDLLGTSEIPGYAAAMEAPPKPGVVFAKALEPVESDKSKRIWAFIMMA